MKTIISKAHQFNHFEQRFFKEFEIKNLTTEELDGRNILSNYGLDITDNNVGFIRASPQALALTCRTEFKKWIFVNDKKTDIAEMTAAEKAAVIADFRAKKIEEFKQKASNEIFQKYPIYVQCNAALGIYDEATKQELSDYINSIRKKFHDYEADLNNAKTLEELEAINYISNV